MVAAALVDRDIREGARVLKALDGDGIPVPAAFWYLDADSQDWRLMLASTLADEKGLFEGYLQINDTLARLHPPTHIRSDDIQLLVTSDPLVSELRIFRGTDPAPFVGDIAISREVLGDIYVQACHLYRAARLVGVDDIIPMEFAIPSPTRGVWNTAAGTVTFKKGFLTSIDAPNNSVKKLTMGVHGANAEYVTVKRKENRNGHQIGQLMRWIWRDGRVRDVTDLPRPVTLEPLPTPS